MGVTKSVEQFNSREQLLSGDLMRAQFLASRDDQDAQASLSRSFDSSVSSPANTSQLLTARGTPISGVDSVPTISAAGGFTMSVSAGTGFLWDPSYPGLTADDSSYLVARWNTTILTFGNPAGNPRIDVVVASPAMVATDSQSRNVLVDPTTRTIAAQNVFKTSNPLATLSVVAGTSAAAPVPPTLPAHAVPLFYVWVKPTAATASDFGVCRATWRRAPYPFAAVSGVLAGMGLKWDLTQDPATGSAAMIAKGFHRLVIDGEVMEFFANMDSTVGGVLPDTANNPFGGAAAAAGQVYYLYAVGGRNNPLPSFNTSDGTLSPVTIVESLTPPVPATGKPANPLTVNGVTVGQNGAAYIGLGFVVGGSTRRAACIMDQDMTWFGTAENARTTHTMGGTGLEHVTLPSTVIPANANRGRMTIEVVSGQAGHDLLVFPDNGSGAAPLQFENGANAAARLPVAATAVQVGQVAEVRSQPTGSGSSLGSLFVTTTHAADQVAITPNAFAHGVRPLGLAVNP